jgi:hypothetical protein
MTIGEWLAATSDELQRRAGSLGEFNWQSAAGVAAPEPRDPGLRVNTIK